MSFYAQDDTVVNIMVPYGLSWHRNYPNTYRDLTVSFLGRRVGDVPHVIYFVVLRGVLLSPCRSIRVQETTPQPPTPNRGSLANVRARQRRDVSREVNYLFIIPWSGAVLGGGGVYISKYFWNTPPRKPPPGDKRWMAVRFALLFGEASSWTAATLPPAKWWKYEGLGLNCRW